MEILHKGGDTSILDKWSKAQMALRCGADLVLELPTVYATSSAENFAEGAIKILNSFNMPVTLSFGSECGNIETLNNIADILLTEPKEYQSILSHELKKGLSFPKARENALLMYLNDIRRYANVLSEPNNILGIEYIKAIKSLKANVTPITIKRIGTNYNSKEISSRFASATAIRQKLLDNDVEGIKKLVPKYSFETLNEKFKYNQLVPSLSCFEKEIIYTLRKMSIQEILDIPDVSEGLENKIKYAVNSYNTLEDLINTIKSKRYTQTRLQRILLYALLGITKKDIQVSYKAIPYIRVLAMNTNGKYLISKIKQLNKKVQIVTSVKKYMDTCTDRNMKSMLEKDILATNIYTLAYDYNPKANLDYITKIITE